MARTRTVLAMKLAGPAIAVAVAAIGIAATAVQGVGLDPLGALVTDAFQRAEPREYDPDSPVKIVAIDEESIRRYGQWPWPRTYVAELVDRLNAFGVAAIAFDILFADPDRTSPEIIREMENRFKPDAPPTINLVDTTQHDRILARTIAQSRVALGAVPAPRRAEDAEAEPFRSKFGLASAGSDPRPALTAFEAVIPPLDIFVENAQGYGVTGVDLGAGAVVRRAHLFSTVGGAVAPSLTMEALRVAQGARTYVLQSSDSANEQSGGAEPVIVSARNGAVEIPLTPDGAIWLRHAGPQEARYIPAWRVLEAEPGDADLARRMLGRIVLVGATAPALRYVVETPIAAGVDAVEVHAETIEQILDGVSLQRPDWAPGAEAVAVALAALLALGATLRLPALSGAVVAAILVAGLFAGAWYAFAEHDLLLSPVWPGLTVVGCYLPLTLLNYIKSRRESGAVRAQFARFVSPDIIKTLANDPESPLRLGGVSRELTILFCDARGFTTMSETMPPDALIDYLNACLGALTEEVLMRGGTVDKYIGDCLMAFWNAPVDCPDHADRAIDAMLGIRSAQMTLNEGFVPAGLPKVDFGVGMNTGSCSVGLMGASQRLEYSCVGDTVNVAARVQDLTKTYGVWNIIGDNTAQAQTQYEIALLDEAGIRGRARAERLWTVIGPKHPETARAVERFQAAYDAARSEPLGSDAFEAALERLRATDAPGIDPERVIAALMKRRAGEVPAPQPAPVA